MILVNDTPIENDTYSSYGVGLSFYEDKSNGEGSITVKIILTSFLGIFMVFSLIGNVCTCAVIARDKNMRTPTNCYLLNLAITDLMIALFVPIEIYLIWEPNSYPLSEEGCTIHFLLWDLLSNCSVLTILAFTIERYLVISKPFLRQTLVLNSRVLKIVSINWAVSCLFSIPNAFYVYLVERKQNVYCFFTVPDTEKTYLVAVELLVFYVLPMTVIFVLYVLIAIKLKYTKSTSRPNPVYGKQKRNKAVKILVAVAASFFICWSPYSLLRLMILIPGLNYDAYFNGISMVSMAWMITQVLTEHGGFAEYLCKTAHRLSMTECHDCGPAVHSAQHTLEVSPRLVALRRDLTSIFGGDFSLPGILTRTLRDDKFYVAIVSLCETVMSQKEADERLWRAVVYLSSINIYMSTAVNPILYSLMSHKFRNAFRDLLKSQNTTQIIGNVQT